MKRSLYIFLAVMLFLTAAALPQAQAATFNLSDNNSTISVTSESQSGAYNWVVDGTYQMYQQQWFYGPSATGQSSIDTLTLTNSGTAFGNYAFFNYVDPAGSFSIATTYSLAGGQVGSKSSDLSEQITVNNLSGAPLTFRLYLYTDFDLNGTSGGDNVFTNGLHHAVQWEGNIVLSETIVGPDANKTEVGFFANTLSALNSGVAYSLNNVSGPLGPGDMTWAFEWDVVIANGGSFQISLDKNIVPIPGSLVLLGSGVLGLLGIGIRRKSA